MDKNDLISRSALKDAFWADVDNTLHYTESAEYELIMLEIDEAPAVDFEELRPRGCWVYDNNGDPCCSICGGVDGLDREEYLIRHKIRDNASNYCPNCGARMGG